MKKLNLIECAGTAYEIGRQYGEAAYGNIMKTLNMGLGAVTAGYKVTREEVVANAMKYLPRVRDFDPYLVEMLEGQAEGAGISFEEAFTGKCLFDLLFHYSKVATGMCTSFSASKEATADGKTILGQTIDWSPGSPIDMLKVRHADGTVQLVLQIWGLEYTLSSAGFGICANGTWTAEKGYPSIPYGCYMPKVMRQNNMAGAVEILRQAARGLCYFQLADTEGEMMGIESVLDGYNFLKPDKNILVHANNYLTMKYKPKDLSLAISPSSKHRLNRMKKLMKNNYGALTPQLMMDILADHDEHPNSICAHIDESKPPQFHSKTIAAFVMVPEEGIMYVAAGNPCEEEFVEFRL